MATRKNTGVLDRREMRKRRVRWPKRERGNKGIKFPKFKLNVSNLLSDPDVRKARIAARVEKTKARTSKRTEVVRAKGESGKWDPESVKARAGAVGAVAGAAADVAGAAIGAFAPGGGGGWDGMAESFASDETSLDGQPWEGDEQNGPPIGVIVAVVAVILIVVAYMATKKKG